jgi:hypothetical protein
MEKGCSRRIPQHKRHERRMKPVGGRGTNTEKTSKNAITLNGSNAEVRSSHYLFLEKSASC